MIILDTSVIIKIIHNRINLAQLKKSISEAETFGVSSISLYEIYFGLYQIRFKKDGQINQEKWDNELRIIKLIEDKLEVIEFNSKAAQLSAEIFNLLRSKGETIELFDCMIAGNMKAFGYRNILTTNENHFLRISDIDVHLI